MIYISKESQMLSEFHERQLKTLEQGINDISVCIRRNRLNVLFLYDDEIVHGKITAIHSDNFTVRNKLYYYDKIDHIYSYFTLQRLSLELLEEWYHMEDEE